MVQGTGLRLRGGAAPVEQQPAGVINIPRDIATIERLMELLETESGRDRPKDKELGTSHGQNAADGAMVDEGEGEKQTGDEAGTGDSQGSKHLAPHEARVVPLTPMEERNEVRVEFDEGTHVVGEQGWDNDRPLMFNASRLHLRMRSAGARATLRGYWGLLDGGGDISHALLLEVAEVADDGVTISRFGDCCIGAPCPPLASVPAPRGAGGAPILKKRGSWCAALKRNGRSGAWGAWGRGGGRGVAVLRVRGAVQRHRPPRHGRRARRVGPGSARAPARLGRARPQLHARDALTRGGGGAGGDGRERGVAAAANEAVADPDG